MDSKIHQYITIETENRIRIYEDLLKKWNRRTGLVQQDTIKEFDVRHVLDSLQIIPIIHKEYRKNAITQIEADNIDLKDADFVTKMNPLEEYIKAEGKLDTINDLANDLRIIDIGTGAGFPGMILSICGFKQISLCESNYKKCVFLEEVARQTETDVNILHKPIEMVTDQYDIVLSRALTELEKLLEMMSNISTNGTCGIFHKGQAWKSEVSVAHNVWKFKIEAYQSITSSPSVVVAIHKLIRRNQTSFKM